LAFVGIDRVGCIEKKQARPLKALAGKDRCRNYCGRAADAGSIRYPDLAVAMFPGRAKGVLRDLHP
jgi:hypothetical protein